MKRLNSSLMGSLNNSPSKQRYSFPKSSRFQSQHSQGPDSFYNLPTIGSRRSASFGYGSKDIGIRYEKKWPSPEAYHIPSGFEGRKNGFSFGEGREDMQLTGFLSDSITKRDIPSPNLYNPAPQSTAKDITLKSRIKDRSLQHFKKVPGPGAYNWQQMGASNYYITSNTKNKINFKISNSPRPDTLDLRKNQNTRLGPGSYDLKSTELNSEGKYFNSKINNSKAARFSRGSRPQPVIKHLLTTPGPTKYEKSSDFDN